MKRRMAVLLTTLLLTIGLGACGGDSDDAGNDVSTPDVTEDTASLEEVTTDVEGTETTPEELTEGEDVAGETTVETDEFALLVEYLENGNGDYINVGAPKVIAAADVMADGLDSWTILDIRTQDKYGPDANGDWQLGPNEVPDYDDGHIEGAESVAWTEIVEYAEANLTTTDKILVVCYTGQQAGQAVVLLNLLGFDAYSLKWGMSAWNGVFDVWTPNISSDFTAQFTTDADPGKNDAGDYPTLDTGLATGEEILRARIDAFLADGTTRIVTAADVFAAPEDYYIINYWPEAEYLDPGHIDGSHQYTPKASLRTDADLATLPTDMPIAVYCYSGQHGAQVATWLTLLGYDAWDIKFGTNGMFFDSMTGHKWSEAGDYEFVSGE